MLPARPCFRQESQESDVVSGVLPSAWGPLCKPGCSSLLAGTALSLETSAHPRAVAQEQRSGEDSALESG